ncbi:2-oxo acid dehydrogenase subunit E2 [Nitrospirillum iridis]|uniref:Dihydrolipoyllysine-residue acetyltransferase component of pyruvate dehydrogenase complex n=1 Tax=Nitrospirillum iridis TaxID=765888 RepID=A0A7X0B042_9PROT|nr:2-oxo acid dehydrogenase subunit E2 [Nitrospirillum iridis]MBB6253298.1 pyruvate dehydrogenase E2 component (dihydrolipoamide acetyltransferase) [Nitrospirillum iridis]
MGENRTGLLDGLPPWPEVDHAAFGPVERRPLSRVQQLTGGFLARNWVAIPHVTHNDEADVTALEAARTSWNRDHPDRKLTLLVPLIKAVAAALAAHPQFNASIENGGKALIFKKYVHIGVAVDTPGGLFVPVIRDCDRKPVTEIAAELSTLSERARTKGLPMADMSGGCFTVTSLGHIGGTTFTPIINAPEVAILGLTRLIDRPAPGEGGAVIWRRMLPLSLSYDHRVINGADAARFTRHVANTLMAAPEFS